MDRNKILHGPRHLGVPSGASKKISELMVCSARTVHQSTVKTSTISKRTETSFHLSLVTLDYHPVRPKRFLGLWYTWCKPCTYLALKLTLSPNRNKLPFEPRHPGVPSGASKTISNPTVRLAQSMHLSCTKTNTISKRIKTRFYMTHVTQEFHRVRLKRFLKLWYVWCKLWTYLAPILTISPNGPKQYSSRPTSPRSSNGCVENDF
jgi:hypothetical protein